MPTRFERERHVVRWEKLTGIASACMSTYMCASGPTLGRIGLNGSSAELTTSRSVDVMLQAGRIYITHGLEWTCRLAVSIVSVTIGKRLYQ